MTNFALKKIEAIEGKQEFVKLCIDNDCQFDEFEKSISNNPKLTRELGSIYHTMELVANGESLPQKRFKDITPDKEIIKEYEFKSHKIRVYAIKKENGKIIVFGGFKTNQKKDLRKFRNIKKRFLIDLKL